MTYKLLVFDSHPVQYRVPVWQKIEEKRAGIIKVIYASDCSVKGFNDVDFGKVFAWDEPMLERYKSTFLHNENGKPLTGWNSLTGKGVREIISKYQPEAILLTGLNYRYDLTVLIYAKIKGIPLWLRCETQDFANDRGRIKTIVRSIIYKLIYKHFNKFFYIGELNKLHYLSHNVLTERLYPAKYCTVNRYSGMSTDDKIELRNQIRSQYLIKNENIVIGFSGKFIQKKNPSILFEIISYLPIEMLPKVILYFVGSGEMEENLKETSQEIISEFKVRSIFTGFMNQSEIGLHYLAMDIFVLPSRKMGETWGLVVNEALQAGCAIITSNAVGCSTDFSNLERFSIFEEGNVQQLSEKILHSAKFERNFDWADNVLNNYSIESVADSLIAQID